MKADDKKTGSKETSSLATNSAQVLVKIEGCTLSEEGKQKIRACVAEVCGVSIDGVILPG